MDDTCSRFKYGLSAQTWCILSYADSLADTTINYTMLCLSLAACIHALLLEPPSEEFPRKAGFFTCVEAGLCFFQLSLCYIVGCAGVSIVWNANAGFLLALLRVQERDRRLLGLVILLALGTDIYYLLTTDELTTTAHALAVFLGYSLSLFYTHTFGVHGQQLR